MNGRVAAKERQCLLERVDSIRATHWASSLGKLPNNDYTARCPRGDERVGDVARIQTHS